MPSLENLFQRPIATFLVSASLLILGLVLISDIPIKLYPNTRKTRISVRIPHPSISAKDFERDFGEKLSETIETIEGIDEVETTFNNGSTAIYIYFDWGFDGQQAKGLVASAMASIKSQLPPESERLSVNFWAGKTAGFYALAVYSPELESKELFNLLESRIKPKLERVKNVDFAQINPVEETRVDIILATDKLLEYQLMPGEVADTIRKSHKDLSLGSFRDGRNAYAVRIIREIESILDVKNIIVKTIGQTQVTLAQVAEVKIYNGLPHHLYSINGKQAIVIFAMPDQNGNVRDLASEINEIVDEAKKTLPDHIQFQKLVDPGDYINGAIKNVIVAGCLGGVLAIIIMLFFLGDIRNTLLISLSIPLSIAYAFILMSSFDVSINLISLGGLTLAIGMIVDSSIVVIENIFRHIKNNADTDIPLLKTISCAVSEVRAAVFASTLTSIVVFLPINYTSELTAAILGDLARTVVFVLVCSMLVAIIVIPSLACKIFSSERGQRFDNKKLADLSQRLRNGLQRIYKNALIFLLRNQRRTIMVVIAPVILLFVLLVLVAPRIGREIMAKPDSAKVSLQFTNLESKNQEELLKEIVPIEGKIIDEYKDVLTSLFARIHRANSGAFTLTLNRSDLVNSVIDRLEKDFRTDQKWKFEIRRWDPSELPLPRTDDLRISLTGPDQKTVVRIMNDAMTIIQDADLYADVSSEPSTEESSYILAKPRYPILPHFDENYIVKLAESGRVILAGQEVIQMTHKGETLNIELSFPESHISNQDQLANYLISTQYGPVPLKHFFDFEILKDISEIEYRDGKKIFSLNAKMKQMTPRWHRTMLEEKVRNLLTKNLELPKEYSFVVEDTQQEINDAMTSLIKALLASACLIFVILGIQFNSFRGPLVIMTAVPLGLIGVIASLYTFNSTVSLNSMLGTILLGGVAVNNSILIYDFYVQNLKQFNDHVSAIIYACELRIIPITITSLTTIIGMMPIAFALGDGTNVIQPLGIAVAGGLGISTLTTVFVIPCSLSLLTSKHPLDPS